VKTSFLAVLWVVAAAYTVLAFRLDFMLGEMRPGPGFFPRILGVGLLLFLSYSLALEAKHRAGTEPVSEFWKQALVFAAWSTGLFALMNVVGSLLGITLYLFVALAWLSGLKRERFVFHVVLSAATGLFFVAVFSWLLDTTLPTSLGDLLP
jgi:hypothetical protein